MKEPQFLTLAEVHYLHQIALKRDGGSDGVRDSGTLDGAVYQPKTAYGYGRDDLFELAATYILSIAESQACVDGNKRAAVASGMAFLRREGIILSPLVEEPLYTLMVGEGPEPMSIANLAQVLRDHQDPSSSP